MVTLRTNTLKMVFLGLLMMLAGNTSLVSCGNATNNDETVEDSQNDGEDQDEDEDNEQEQTQSSDNKQDDDGEDGDND